MSDMEKINKDNNLPYPIIESDERLKHEDNIKGLIASFLMWLLGAFSLIAIAIVVFFVLKIIKG